MLEVFMQPGKLLVSSFASVARFSCLQFSSAFYRSMVIFDCSLLKKNYRRNGGRNTPKSSSSIKAICCC